MRVCSLIIVFILFVGFAFGCSKDDKDIMRGNWGKERKPAPKIPKPGHVLVK